MNLAAALAVVCLWSASLCATGGQVTIVEAPRAPFEMPNAYGWVDWPNRTVYVTLSGNPNADRLPTDQALALPLAHELTHVQQFQAGQSYTSETCRAMEFEAYMSAYRLWDWLHVGQEFADAQGTRHDYRPSEGAAQVMAILDCREHFG